ncbi:mitochondrial outer membrane protein porin of 36 kDa-like [Coffea eugenioides]|uniref:Mitochondrial outer membrane protein porin of 36 kDa-like n=1 Tax=Coffea arabica TaxID=13443 RepID=A0A6P6XEY3_COFAR|nr:mitochondrial outer membrane protein porin of 36 kDa-like [Coffea arabica]XP_027167504.1 mitochondrial outer membrane protein porin of 36 kDa-like [Coffea eugenioides]
MGRKPGFYSDIGKGARGLLHGYVHQPPIHYRLGWFNLSFHLLSEIDRIVRGLSAAFQVVMPYQRSSMVEVQYLHDFAGITMGASLTRSPVVNFSSVLGTSSYNIGTAISVDTLLGQLSQWDAGLSLNTRFLSAAVTLTEMGNVLSASCYSEPLRGTAVAAELTHRFWHEQTVFRFGGQHSLTESTRFKVQAGTDGNISAAVRHTCFSAVILTIAGELNVRAMRSSKMGISCSFHHALLRHFSSSMGIPFSIEFEQ